MKWMSGRQGRTRPPMIPLNNNALHREVVSMNEETDISMLKQMLSITKQVFGSSCSVVEAFEHRQIYTQLHALKAMNSYLAKGGQTQNISVVSNDRAPISDRLKQKGIPFLSSICTDKDGNTNYVITYRKKDAVKVSEILKTVEMKKAINAREVSLEKFTDAVAGKSFFTAGGLTKEELYAFRASAAGKDLLFCTLLDEKDPSRYKIVADKRSGLMRVLSDMAYDISGSDGRGYMEKMHAVLMQREDFTKNITPPCYIVDAKNPAHFIAVESDRWSTHSLGASLVTGIHGEQTIDVSDQRFSVHFDNNTQEIVKKAASFFHPVILSPENFKDMVSHISKNGRAIVSKNLSPDIIHTCMDTLQEQHSRAFPALPHPPGDPSDESLLLQKEALFDVVLHGFDPVRQRKNALSLKQSEALSYLDKKTITTVNLNETAALDHFRDYEVSTIQKDMLTR